MMPLNITSLVTFQIKSDTKVSYIPKIKNVPLQFQRITNVLTFFKNADGQNRLKVFGKIIKVVN